MTWNVWFDSFKRTFIGIGGSALDLMEMRMSDLRREHGAGTDPRVFAKELVHGN